MYEILIRNVISLNHIAKVRRNPTDSKEFATFFSDLLRHSILFATNLYCTPMSCRKNPSIPHRFFGKAFVEGGLSM